MDARPVESRAELEQTDPSGEVVLLDVQQLVERCMGNLELAGRLITQFLSRLDNSVDEIGTAVTQEDLSKVSQLAHRLKGEAGNLGSEKIRELAATLEEAARANRAEEAGSIVVELRDVCGLLKDHPSLATCCDGEGQQPVIRSKVTVKTGILK